MKKATHVRIYFHGFTSIPWFWVPRAPVLAALDSDVDSSQSGYDDIISKTTSDLLFGQNSSFQVIVIDSSKSLDTIKRMYLAIDPYKAATREELLVMHLCDILKGKGSLATVGSAMREEFEHARSVKAPIGQMIDQLLGYLENNV